MQIFQYPPLFVALFMFTVDFGAIVLIRLFLEGHTNPGKTWSYRLGDSIFLPLYGYFATSIVQSFPMPSIWQNSLYHLAIFALGFFVSFSLRYFGIKNKFITHQQASRPSEIYHLFIFVPIFYIVVSTLPMLIAIHPPTIWFKAAMLVFFLYSISYLVDLVTMHSAKKGTYWSLK